MSTASREPVVLVTGCSEGGIGYYLCKEFDWRGCTVYATARNLSKLSGLPPNIVQLQLDVTSESSVLSTISTVGQIDVLVNNAGILAAGALLDHTDEDVYRAFDTNAFSVLRMCRAVVPGMAERGKGVIINVSSITERLPSEWNGLYCATKSAVRAMCDVLEMECKPLGIHVMNLAPAAVRSNLCDNQLERFQIPETSLWKAHFPAMIRCISLGKGAISMDTAEFARRVVDRILEDRRGRDGEVNVRREIPSHFIEGGGKVILKILTVMPRSWVSWFLRRLFGKIE